MGGPSGDIWYTGDDLTGDSILSSKGRWDHDVKLRGNANKTNVSPQTIQRNTIPQSARPTARRLRPPRRQLRLFVLHAPRLRTLHLSGVESWPAPIAENLPRICCFDPNPESLGRDLKNSPSLREIATNGVYWISERVGTKLFKDLFDSRRATHLDGLGECCCLAFRPRIHKLPPKPRRPYRYSLEAGRL